MEIITRPPVRGSTLVRGKYQKINTEIAADSFAKLAWEHVSGNALLNLTDPDDPTVIQGGVYAVMPQGSVFGNDAPYAAVEIVMGAGGLDLIQWWTTEAAEASYGAVTGVWYVPAGGTIQVWGYNDAASPQDFSHFTWVQLLVPD